MRRLRHPLIIATLVACSVVLLVVAVSPRWAAHAIAAELRQRIDAADESTAPSLVEQLGPLNAAGLEHLIALLDDERRLVRQAARATISQRLEFWSRQETASSRQNVEQLAAVLASRGPPRDAHSRVFVKLTALKLLRLPAHASGENRFQFLTDCSTVLERTLSAHVEGPEVARTVQIAEPASAELTDSALAETPFEPLAEIPQEPAESEPADELLNSSDESALPPAEIELHRPRRMRSSEINLPSNQVDDEAIRALPTRSLIRHLHDVPATAEFAERELVRRGFDENALKLARALDHADPRVRQQLCEALPGMSDIDPAPWLWELAEDSDDEVRRTARGILAASSNPQTRGRVSRLK